jgi:hypothetical protein
VSDLPTFALTEITLQRSGIFRLWGPDAAKRGMPSRAIKHGDLEYVFAVPPAYREGWFDERHRLDAGDWRVLMAVTALASRRGEPLTGDKVLAGVPADLWTQLACRGSAAQEPARAVKTTAAELLRVMGLSPGGGQKARLLACLARLSRVRMTVRDPVPPAGQKMSDEDRLAKRRTFHARAFLLAFESAGNRLTVALSPLLAKPAQAQGQFLRISLADIRAVQDDRAILLLALLSAGVKPGDVRRFKYADLAAVIYDAPGPDATPEFLRQRRKRVRDALEIVNRTAAWDIELGPREAAVRRAPAHEAD